MKAGIIGLGVGEAHIAGFEREGVTVSALCDRNPEKLREVATRHPSAHLHYLCAEELLDDPTIDIVSIASYDRDHCAHVIRALENGKHVFVEKPMCTSPEEASAIRLAMAKSPDRKLSSNLILRCSPLFKRVREMIHSGQLGAIFHVDGEYLYGRVEKLTHGWRGDDPNYSVTLGGGVHVIDLLTWLTNDAIEEVQAIGGGKGTAGTRVTFPDTVSALLSFRSGMTGVITSNFPCVHPHFHRLAIYGSQGTMRHDVEGARVFTERDRPTSTPLHEEYRPSGKDLLVSEFVRELRGKSAISIPPEDIFRALSVCFAIDESVRTKRPIKVVSEGE